MQGAPFRSKAPAVRPLRLAHVLVFSTDVPRSIAFYSDVLGLRLSDRSGDVVAFMHGIHGSDHHLLASPSPTVPAFTIAAGTSARQ